MARALSHLHSIIRGSIAGVTYLANQYHQIVIRQRTAPVQPNTDLQTSIRSAMTGANDGWLALTDAQRTAWDLYADGLLWPGPLGPYTVTGRLCMMAMKMLRLFIFWNGYAVPAGPDTAPPMLLGFYNLANVKATTFSPAASTGVAVTFTPEAAVDACVIVEISPPFQPSRKRYKGPWDTSRTQAVVAGAPASYIMNFSDLNVDAIYFLRVRAVADDAPGRVSPEFVVRAVAVTNL